MIREVVVKLAQAGFRETAVLQAFVRASNKTDVAVTPQTSEHLIYVALEASTYADDIDIIGRTRSDMIEAFTSLIKAAKDMDLFINQEKTKYTECPRRNVPDFGRVFLILKYNDITQNTYVQS